MNCNDVLDRIDDFLDGCLDSATAKAIKDHLGGCATCGDEIELVGELRARVDRMPRSAQPPHDLWPAIANEIESAKIVRASFGRRALLAAAAALLIMASVATAYLVGRHQAMPVAQLPAPIEIDESTILLASFAELGVDDYLVTRDGLLDALEARRHELSPDTQKILTENMQVIEEAMARIAGALSENPEDEFLMKQLAGAYRQQIGLLQRAVRLPAEV